MAIGIARRQFISALGGATVCVIGATQRAHTQKIRALKGYDSRLPIHPQRVGAIWVFSPLSLTDPRQCGGQDHPRKPGVKFKTQAGNESLAGKLLASSASTHRRAPTPRHSEFARV